MAKIPFECWFLNDDKVLESYSRWPTVIKCSLGGQALVSLLRDSIDKQLGTLGSTLTLGSLILTATLVMVVQLALVLLKRRDWGRRRALGANRFTIIALIVTHTGMLAVIGATIGVIMSLLVLQIWGDPLPSVSYLGATMVQRWCLRSR